MYLKINQHIGRNVVSNYNPEDGGYMFFQNIGCFEQTTERYIPEDRTLFKLILFDWRMETFAVDAEVLNHCFT
jgi:hypothetical protein